MVNYYLSDVFRLWTGHGRLMWGTTSFIYWITEKRSLRSPLTKFDFCDEEMHPWVYGKSTWYDRDTLHLYVHCIALMVFVILLAVFVVANFLLERKVNALKLTISQNTRQKLDFLLTVITCTNEFMITPTINSFRDIVTVKACFMMIL